MNIATYSTGAQELPLSLTLDQLARHLYAIGKSGSGKSTMLENLASGLIDDGHGVIFIDPHGQTAEKLIDAVPNERIRDTCYFKATGPNYVGFNPMADTTDPFLAATNIVNSMHHSWQSMWGPRMEWLLLNAIHLCIVNKKTLKDIPRVFNSPNFRDKLCDRIRDEGLRMFWEEEFRAYDKRYIDEAKGPILNKVGQFIASPHIRNIVTQTHPKLSIKQTMDESRVLIVNLDKGHLGSEQTNLLGSLLVSHINHLAMQRSGTEAPVFLIIDEFASFGSTIFADMLSEIRKYNVSLVLAHQFIEQIPDKVRPAILGNVGSVISFVVGAEDAQAMAPQLLMKASELTTLPPFRAFGRISPNVQTKYLSMLPFEPARRGQSYKVVSESRARFGRS